MIGLISAALLVASSTQSQITVYNQGFALVKENRSLQLKAGRQTVAIEDVAQMIDPSSVSIRSLTAPGSFQVLEQNYQYDLISPMAILAKSVGQRVRLTRALGMKRDVLEGTLINSPTTVVNSPESGPSQTYNGMVIRADDGRIVLDPTGEVEVMSVPRGLISKPTLVWELESDKAGENSVELSYITQGMSWNSDYVLTLDGLGHGGLQGWVTLNNQSGTTYENALLKLLAGDVNVPRATLYGAISGIRAAGRTAGGGGFAEQSLFEYHLYTLQRPTTVRNKETKQISLLESPTVAVTQRYIVDALQNQGRYFPSEGEIGSGDLHPQVRVEFVNNQANGLGIPLPKGRVRVYQRDNSGSVQLLGEDNIDHTPKGERLSLVVGRAFDIVSSRNRTNFNRISDRAFRETFEIELRNRKDTDVTVDVIERHYGDWKVTDKNLDFTKTSAESMLFRVPLKSNEVRKVVYTVETRW